MPWCEDCDRFFNPNSMPEDGTCPTCGRFLASPVVTEEETKTPWHFWLLFVGVALYLGWRAVQGIVWVAHHI